MPRPTPCLWFDTDGEEAARFYASVFPNSGVTRTTHYGSAGPRAEGLVMTVEFAPGSCDPHGLVWHDGRLVSCDAGIHPGWKGLESPHSGYIFSIDIA